MSNQATLEDLRDRAKVRADMVSSSFVSDATWNEWINEEGSELHDLLVSKFGDDYYLDDFTIHLVTGQRDYDLPTNFLKVRGVDYALGGEPCSLRRFEFEERNARAFTGTVLPGGRTTMRYRVIGGQIRFIPTPAAQVAVTLWYIPQYRKLLHDNQPVSDRLAQGWDSYMVIGAAMRALQKEESDVGVLAAEKANIIQRIEFAASSRDATEPHRIVDVGQYVVGEVL